VLYTSAPLCRRIDCIGQKRRAIFAPEKKGKKKKKEKKKEEEIHGENSFVDNRAPMER